MKTKVVNLRKVTYDVYIGRPSKWGNPFTIGPDGNRKEVIRKYKDWIVKQQHLLDDLHELKGKILGCFCAPKACHGDVLAKLADKELSDNESKEAIKLCVKQIERLKTTEED